MISVEHYVACQEALAPLFPKIQLGCNLADFRMEALTLLKRAGIQQKDMLSHWENMEPLWDYLNALASMRMLERSKDLEFSLLFPAWELVSSGWRENPRTDWPARWHAAGKAVDWKGAHRTRMAALKASPIWTALGNGEGGFRDALGNPFPPFAIYSSYEWNELDFIEARELGLINENWPRGRNGR